MYSLVLYISVNIYGHISHMKISGGRLTHHTLSKLTDETDSAAFMRQK